MYEEDTNQYMIPAVQEVARLRKVLDDLRKDMEDALESDLLSGSSHSYVCGLHGKVENALKLI